MIDSNLPPEEAFAYLADFANARHWDPSVVEAERRDAASLGTGSSFDLSVKFGGRTIPMRFSKRRTVSRRKYVGEASGCSTPS